MLVMSASGCVIDENARNRVFEPSLTRTRQGRVTGMELACVYGIVNQCGGYIGVDSEPGHGIQDLPPDREPRDQPGDALT